MARVDNLSNFLSDVADAIREKKGTEETIQASDFDTEIASISSGADLSEYFNTTISSNTNNANIPIQILQKTPNITVANNVTSLYAGFQNSKMSVLPKITFGNNIQGVGSLFLGCTEVTTIDCSGFDTSGVLVMSSMFDGCTSLTSLDLSNFYTPNLANVYSMFKGCTSLTYLDIRNMTLSNITSSSSYNNMFNLVPNNCEIIVKDSTEKEWITSKFTNLTNVKTVEELE